MYQRFDKLFFKHNYTIAQPLSGTFSSLTTLLSKNYSSVPLARGSAAFPYCIHLFPYVKRFRQEFFALAGPGSALTRTRSASEEVRHALAGASG